MPAPPLPDAILEGGDLDCGSGLLLLIRRHIDPLRPGQLLEIRSTERSVEEDLPAWCRLTGNELVESGPHRAGRRYLVCKSARTGEPATAPPAPRAAAAAPPAPIVAPAPIAPLCVLGIGSWPRPRWLLQAIHEHMEGRLAEEEFQATADDAVRLAVAALRRAGVDAVTDGEQRRDSYASFVGGRLDNCQLIPLTDLLPLVDDPEEFRRELAALEVPASEVRHPAVFGRLGRSRPIVAHELAFARALTDLPVKVALPGPYLLSRTLWMECISDRAYASRERLAEDVVRVLREEIGALLAGGASIVQLDEPVLTEVVFGAPRRQRGFMCGALSQRGDPVRELAFGRDLVNAVLDGFPRERLAIHVCRGNWTRDESVALRGDYSPLVPFLRELRVGTYFLESCTPRAGELELLRGLPDDRRLGVGVVDQKDARVETVAEVGARMRRAVALFGRERVLFTPDCGFATFADSPITAAATAEGKLRAMAQAAARLRA